MSAVQQPSLFTDIVPVTYERHESLDQRFDRFISTNPQVLDAFIYFAGEAQRRGRQRIGAKAIVERLRWEWLGRTEGDEFRLNNSFTSRLARAAVARKAELAELFEFRELRS